MTNMLAGLSLMGFMEAQTALDYLKTNCVQNNKHKILYRMWEDARKRLGPAIPRAGYPLIQDIPEAGALHIQNVPSNPRFAASVAGMASWEFKLVEVDPLLCFQFHLMAKRADDLSHGVSSPPLLTEMLPICLPLTVGDVECDVGVQMSAAGVAVRMTVKSRDLNLRAFRAGQMGFIAVEQLAVAGVAYGAASPLVQVVRFGGRSYLRNGYHRAYGLRKAGATYIPCLMLHATDFSAVGAPPAPAAFDRALLESGSPPTCGHFAKGRAHPVVLREATRVIDVQWSEKVELG